MAQLVWRGTAGNYNDANNWQLGNSGTSPASPPGPFDQVAINSGVASAGDLEFDFDGQLELGGGELDLSDLLIAGGITTFLPGSVFNYGVIRASGAITIDGGTAASRPPFLSDFGVVDAADMVVGGSTFGLLNLGLTVGEPTPLVGMATVSDALSVGDQAGGWGKIAMWSSGCVLTVTGSADIGNAGSGQVQMFSGDSLQVGTLTAGNAASGIGSIGLVAGASMTVSTATLGEAGSGAIFVSGSFNAGTVVLGDAPGGKGELFISATSSSAGTATVGLLVVGNEGTGTVQVSAGGVLDAQTIVAGEYGTANIAVSGSLSDLAAFGATIGGAMPNATNDLGEPNGTGGNWSYNGGTGSVTISAGASLDAGQTLTLLAIAAIDTTPSQGGIDISSGGALEVGGSSGAEANSLLIDESGLLVGHGQIDSDVTGTLASNGAPHYALTLDNLGTIEAKDGLLDLHGNVTADGTALIDDNAALEIDGTYGSEAMPAGVVDFQDNPAGTLIVGDIDNFYGTLADLSENDLSGSLAASAMATAATTATGASMIASAPTLGSTVVLKFANPGNNTGIIADTIGTLNGNLELQLAKGKDITSFTVLPPIPLSGTSAAAITHDFFQVSQNGTDTVLTYTKGNPIDLAVNGPTARKAGPQGTGVRVGVISGNFGSPADIANDQSLQALPAAVHVLHDAPNGDDEGRAMAQIVHAIAPNAQIYFYSSGAFNPLLGATVNSDASVANAINQLVQAGCNVIVDDVSINGASLLGVPLAATEANTGSLTEQAIDEAASLGITVVTSAGNGPPIFGHALDPHVITVGAMNWEATPTAVGGYLPSEAEPFSSKAPPSSSEAPSKPDITGPDGGPTTLGLASGLSGVDPFFGTSAAAPAVAGVVALMLQASHFQLDPLTLAAEMEQTATSTGIARNQGGAGLVNAQPAVTLAAATSRSLVQNLPSGSAVTSAFSVTTASAGVMVIEADLSRPAGDMKAGSTLQVFVTMSSGVTVSGTPALTLNDGGTAVYDADASDPANASLVFDYTPGSEATANLAITGLLTNGAIVQDLNTISADFSGLFDVPSGLSINSPLRVTSVASSQTGEIASGGTIQVSLTLSNGVTVITAGGAPILELNNGATATYDGALSNPTLGTLVFDYVVGTVDATPDLSVFEVTLPNGTTVQDPAGDNADFSAALNQSLGVQVDPSFVNLFGATRSGAIATGQTVQLDVTMTTPVVIDTSGGVPTIVLNDGETASYDAAASEAASGTLVFDNVVQASDQVPDLEVAAVDLNGAVVNDTHGVAVDFSGALNYPTGLTVNSPTRVTGVTASESGTISVGQTVTLNLELNGTASVAGIDNSSGPPTLTLDDGETASYDDITSTATSLAFDYVVQAGDYSPNLTIVSVNVNGNPMQDALGNNVDFSVAVGAATGVVVVACFAEGTRIATVCGEVPVEALRIGDRVIRAEGGDERIVSIRHRRIMCVQHPRPHMVWPVRVRAGAFGRGKPKRDLLLSPDHALHRDGVLIPVKYLIDGKHVEQVPCKAITYFHIELPRHDVVLAEGLESESYLDTSEQVGFAYGGGVMASSDIGTRIWEAMGCAPLVVSGPKLAAVRAHLGC